VKTTIYKNVDFLGLPLSLSIDYKAKNYLTVLEGETDKTGKVRCLVVSPSLAYELIKELHNLLEWYKSPLYQWARRKTQNTKVFKITTE